jgi:gamma-glutamylcyclotransferase (GGCT)/AIG2-like uncharacterized protein YtfP
MDIVRMRERGIRFSKREWAVLEGYRLVFNKIASRNRMEGYANIVKDGGSYVEGILYDITDEDIEKLDKHEGYPQHYDRKKLKVRLANGETVEAVVYVAQKGMTSDGLKPSKDYLNHLLKGCDLLSKEYCENLRNVETID